jgi:hypothetical protein
MGYVPLVIPPRTRENAERYDRVMLGLMLFPPRGRTPFMWLRHLFVCRRDGHDWRTIIVGKASGRKCARCFAGERT